MEAKVLGMGNALVDILVRIPNDEILNRLNLLKGSMQLTDDERQNEILEAIADLQPQIVCGGSAANTICGLSNLGISTGYVGKIGQDELGDRYMTDLRQNGTEILTKFTKTHTGSCISLISPDSERTLVTCLGAAVELSPEDIDSSVFDNYTHFYVEGYLVQNPELIEMVLKTSHEKGLVTMLDLASYNVVEDSLEFLQNMIRKYVDIVFANEEESTAFTGREDTEALSEIGEMAEDVVLKLGRRGSLVKVGDETARVGIIRANSIDTTGAGDLYSAGFIYGMINGMSAEQCAVAGAITSGNVIEVIGTKMDARRWTNIRQSLKKLSS